MPVADMALSWPMVAEVTRGSREARARRKVLLPLATDLWPVWPTSVLSYVPRLRLVACESVCE